MHNFWQRCVGAATLDIRAYQAIKIDGSATVAALVVVLAVGCALGVGLWDRIPLNRLFLVAPAAVLGWLLWTAGVYLVTNRLLAEAGQHCGYGQLLRTIGFSWAQGVFLAALAIPLLGPFLIAIPLLWMFLSMTVAIRQTLGFDNTARAAGAVFVSLFLFLTLAGLIRWQLS